MAAAKRRQRGGDSSNNNNNNNQDDMNRWYDSVRENASPDDVFWDEMQRQKLLSNRPPSDPISSIGGGEPPQLGRSSPVSTSTAASPPMMSRGRNLFNINSMQEQQQTNAMNRLDDGEEKPKITPKAAEATLNEYAVYQVADNWLDEEIVELMNNNNNNNQHNALWDENVPSLEEQMDAWDREDEEESQDNDDDDDDERTDEPWDTWNNPKARDKPLLDENDPAIRDHILNINNVHDEDTMEEQEAERHWLERLSRITISSKRLERARNNPQAKAYFERKPDTLQGYDQMWVSAVDYACSKNLAGVFRDYGVQFADNFGDFQDTTIEDGLASIEDIASFKARQVYQVTGLPCIASRTSFEIEPVVPDRVTTTSTTGSTDRTSRSATTTMMTNPRVMSGYRFNDVGMHVEYIVRSRVNRSFRLSHNVAPLIKVEALLPFSEPSRVTRFKTCLCYYDGQIEFYEYGMVDCDLIFCNSLRTFIPMSAAINAMHQTCQLTFDLEYQKWLHNRLDAVAFASTAQVKLRDRVLKEGRVLPNDIIDVSAFMDSMVDVNLMDSCAKDLSQLVLSTKPNKILTVATTGLVVALPMAKYLQIPCVYARKERNIVMAGTYTASYSSKTVGKNRELLVAKSHLQEDDRILIVDDFLSSGSSQEALLRIVADSGATAVGVAVLLEKVYESGRQSLSGFNIPVFSLCRIATVKSGVIQLMEEDGYSSSSTPSSNQQ